MTGYPIELAQPTLGVAPEALDPIDVTLAPRELVLAVFDAQMLGVSDIYQAVIASPAVGMHNHRWTDFASNYSQKRFFRAIGNDLGVDPSVSFEDAEHDGLAASAPATLAAHTLGTEVGFIDLHFASLERSSSLAFTRQAFPQQQINLVDRANRNPRKPCGIRGREVQAEVTQNLSKTQSGELGAFVVAVSHGGTEVKSTSGLSSAS